jgi:small subunit ribosomal protein S4
VACHHIAQDERTVVRDQGSPQVPGHRGCLRAHAQRVADSGAHDRSRSAFPDAIVHVPRIRICPGHSVGSSGSLASRMDKNGPKHKMCRRVGAPLCGRPNCPSNKRPYPPGQHGRGRKRISEYQTRLLEKQKLRHIYGVNEKQMRRYYERANQSRAVTGEEMIRQLETRLDTVCRRLGLALTTSQARQLVSHGHVAIDGRRNDVPSAQVKPGQTITLSPKARNFIFVREALEVTPEPPMYLYRNKEEVSGVLSRHPERDEIPLPVTLDERLIVEFYS